MGKYNEQLQKAGVLLALDGLTPPSTIGICIATLLAVQSHCQYRGRDQSP
jgi:hypothetical protein